MKHCSLILLSISTSTGLIIDCDKLQDGCKQELHWNHEVITKIMKIFGSTKKLIG